jgi:hypothetical protein
MNIFGRGTYLFSRKVVGWSISSRIDPECDECARDVSPAAKENGDSALRPRQLIQQLRPARFLDEQSAAEHEPARKRCSRAERRLKNPSAGGSIPPPGHQE